MRRTISIALALFAVLLGTAIFVIFIIDAARSAGAGAIVSLSIYGSIVVLLHVIHLITLVRVRHIPFAPLIQKFNSVFVFLLIAGSYTPIYLAILPTSWGVSLLSVTWAFAIIGIALKLSPQPLNQKLAALTFIIVDWSIVIAFVPLHRLLPPLGLRLLTLGSLLYAFSIILERRYVQETITSLKANIPQIFLILGNTSHFLLIYLYILHLKL
ncbi:MAG TPA: hemolysin III family protein [Candidatus Paceibacterota bacterium]